MSTYREDDWSLSDLEQHEGLALGGLLRILIRLDGSFSEEEEKYLDAVAEDVGSRDELWALISRSAQEHKNDDAIREHAKAVERSGARTLIRHVLESVARAETITDEEQSLIDWLDSTWA